MKKLFLAIICSILSLLLTACNSSETQYSLIVTNTGPQAGTFVANIGQTAVQSYQLTLAIANSVITIPSMHYSVNLSQINPPFSVIQNTCQNANIGTSCTISIQYAPTSSADYFNQQTLTLSSYNASQTLNLNGLPATLTVPLLPYQQDQNPNRTGINITVGDSNPVTAMLDSGSGPLVIEHSYLGPQVQLTNQPLYYTYSNTTITGVLAYASVTIGGNSHLTTSIAIPIMVVPDDSLYHLFASHAVLGVRMNVNISAKDYLPYPYNQMILIDRPHSEITFGSFNSTQMQTFNTIQLPNYSCSTRAAGIPSSLNISCWDDNAIPVNYTIADAPTNPTQYGTVFDSGEVYTTFYVQPPIPSWIQPNFSNQVSASITTSNGVSLPIPLTTERTLASDAQTRMNAGPVVFNYYQILFDQADGIIGLKASS